MEIQGAVVGLVESPARQAINLAACNAIDLSSHFSLASHESLNESIKSLRSISSRGCSDGINVTLVIARTDEETLLGGVGLRSWRQVGEF